MAEWRETDSEVLDGVEITWLLHPETKLLAITSKDCRGLLITGHDRDEMRARVPAVVAALKE